MFSSTSSRATHLFLSCVVTRALILFFFCLQRKMPRTPPLKFAPTRGEDKPPPDRTRSDSRPAGKCFKVRTHACREVAHLSCEQGPPPPLYCKAQVQHTSSFGSLAEQNECKINTAGIRTASDLYTKILTDPKRFEVAFLFIKKTWSVLGGRFLKSSANTRTFVFHTSWENHDAATCERSLLVLPYTFWGEPIRSTVKLLRRWRLPRGAESWASIAGGCLSRTDSLKYWGLCLFWMRTCAAL